MPQTQTPPSMQPIQPMKQKSIGPVIGIVIIVIVLIIGALYFWGARLNRQAPVEAQPLSSSDIIADISADLSATAINGIDADLDAMEAELE